MSEKLMNLRDLLEEQIKDLYSAEDQMTRALPKMIRKASDPQLKTALEGHLKETENQKSRLVNISGQMGVDLKGAHCRAMEGLVKEGEELLSKNADPDVMDAGII